MEDTGIDSKLKSELSEISNSDKCDRTASHRCDQPQPTTTFNLNHHDPATTTTTTTITSTAITTSSTTANNNMVTTTMTTMTATGRVTAMKAMMGRGQRRCAPPPS